MMVPAGRTDSYSPRRQWCFCSLDFGSMGLGPAYRSFMTSAMPTISSTSLPHTASPPQATELNTKRTCVSRISIRSLTSRHCAWNPTTLAREWIAVAMGVLRE